MRTPLCSTTSPGLSELGITAALHGEIDDDRARPHAFDHGLGDKLRRRAPRDQRCGDDDVLRLDVIGHERRLLLLVVLGHLFGIAGRRLGLTKFIILDGDELGAERGHLLLDRGAHVGRSHDGAEPPRRGDGLKASDAHAHDEHSRGRHGAGSCHHHRQSALEGRCGIDHGLIAREICLARQYVHALRAADARHQLHGEKGGAGLRQRLQAIGIRIRIDHGDEQGTGLYGLDQRKGRPPYREHDVGGLHRIGICRDDIGTSALIVLIGEMGAKAGARANQHLGP